MYLKEVTMNISQKYILAIDAGTTGIRAVIFNKKGEILAKSYREFTQYFPQAGWVEHDPEQIWQVTLEVVKDALIKGKIGISDIAAIGITNQRETTIIWDKDTGRPVYKAIVWQCRRTAPLCERLRAEGLEKIIRDKTGLIIDPYFSATKIKWILDKFPRVKDKAKKGGILFGTVDSWLLWKLTGGRSHFTDYTNASRTMLFNIHQLKWDKELLDIFDIPEEILPQVKPSIFIFGYTKKNDVFSEGIPIAGIMGDQQAALFGQVCFQSGMIKSTYGTGCFLVLNTGKKIINSSRGLLTSLFCSPEGDPLYVLEGSVFIAGAAIQWLRDGLGLIKKAAETEIIARNLSSTNGVYVVPAFTGLGAPYWDSSARGGILGITRGTKREHVIRATLESIAYQTRDIIDVMSREAGISLSKLKVDGGVSQNNWLMQFQADILNIPVERPYYMETTSTGAGYIAGVSVGYWKKEEISHLWKKDRIFVPHMQEKTREKLYKGWKEAVKRVLTY